MNRLRRWLKSRRFLWVSLILIGLAAMIVSVSRPRRPTAPVVVLSRPVQMPTPLLDRLFRFVPATKSWGWVWRTRQFVFGRRKPVNLFSEILAVDPAAALTGGLLPGAPTFSDAGSAQVWILGRNDLESARKRLKGAAGTDVLSRPRVITGDECEAALFAGNTVMMNGPQTVGLSVRYYPRVHPESIDLIAVFAQSELVSNLTLAASSPASPASLRTNLDLALRLQIPKGSGVLVLQARTGEPERKAIALLLDPP